MREQLLVSSTRQEVERKSVYHVLQNPMDSEEEYADPDEEEMNNIYHVLEGPTPEGEEESEGDKAESEKLREKKKGIRLR